MKIYSVGTHYKCLLGEAVIMSTHKLSFYEEIRKMNQCMTKPTKWHVGPGKTHISLGICPVGSESLLCTQWVAKDPSVLHADSND